MAGSSCLYAINLSPF
ncbi:uncharacterized protein FFC1_04831 [Fusarium fujikuroi]|nr:uncharacterized protein FFC1_04831 [Fusarium fujikuroi]